MVITKDLDSLHISSEDISKDELDSLSTLLLNSIREAKKAVGLALPQIGIYKRGLIVEIKRRNFLVMVNPLILNHEGKCKSIEGCLSIEHNYLVERPKVIEVEYVGGDGVKRVESFKGELARRINHEIDHLNGILISDIGKKLGKNKYYNLN